MSKAQKEQILAQLKTYFQKAKSFVIANYQGLTVKEITDFRAKLDEVGAHYQVAKRTLIKKAAADSGYTLKDEQLEGAIGVAFAFTDEIAPIRVSYKFAKEHNKLKPLAGMMGSEELTIEELKKLATLPGRPELLAKLMGSLKSPLTGFVYVLAGPLRGFQSVISQLQQQKASR
ncbi:MAG: 50S ribosomal protein L10 [Candidatus Abawacabacteria bacterium RIFCSPHIGHO2_01_FULL_46_8]|uniref:Large ribosomal subunit protein uL10 n=1 Tax=Candidatus Abawacabacteria bacterium RIFCSPHIGHO2_01_FULL_46_8 TaxID=1817815 RepID=A0A1F4XM22_9BACT|nr:MAG: 50S ribosomal protein L10 [Candidatus Abawacabacteria bacterium RIFCSPHIGHO2_01_FULL_46_8]